MAAFDSSSPEAEKELAAMRKQLDVLRNENIKLSKEAQQALRRTMENYTSTCRFILSCNYSSKIIDPIQSRCTIFKFKPLAKEKIFEIIEKISQNENLTLDDAAKEAVFVASGGDCRKMENILQSCACLSSNISEANVYEIASAAKPEEIKNVLEMAVKGDFLNARKELLKTMLQYGLSGWAWWQNNDETLCCYRNYTG